MIQTAQVPSGFVFFRQGDTSQEVYHILSGAVDISLATPNGPVSLANLGPGDVFGEMAMIDERPRSATAIAAVPSEVELLSPEDFESIVLNEPARLRPYLASFFERLRNANSRLELALRPPKPGPTVPAGPGRPTTVPPPGSAAFPTPTPSAAIRATIRPANPEAAARCPAPEIVVDRFPFRIGRASASPHGVVAANNLSLRDQPPFHISRSHCSIDLEGGRVLVRDRASTLGTIVNGEAVGMDAGVLDAPLHPGDNELVLGENESPFRFIVSVG